MSVEKKITVIGGSGFIGTHLCRSFTENNIAFEIIDLKESRRFPEYTKIGDVRDINSLRKTITGDVIVNLAAKHRDDLENKEEYYNTNVIGAENITRVCYEKKIFKIVFTSTVAVYGISKNQIDENGAINPSNEYGRTKFVAEEKYRSWQSVEKSGNELIIIRPTVVFGEGNRGNVYNLFETIASERFVMIGSGSNIKSMAYIGNLIPFLNKCIQTSEKYALYNYVDSPDLDMNSLVRYVRTYLKGTDTIGLRLPYWLGLCIGVLADGFVMVTGKKIRISLVRIKKFCSSSSFSTRKAELDDFKAPYSLKQGINRTLRSEFIDPSENKEVFFTE